MATRAGPPQFVKDEFAPFLECGILAHGFLRLRCGDCGHDKRVAFSCKLRGFCPSCAARRTAQTAALLADHVIPHVSVRQWALSWPIMLHKIISRTMKLLTRRGVLVEEEGSTSMADDDGDSDEARVLRPLQAVACTHRIAFGPRAGHKVLTLHGVMPRDADFKQTLCADIGGFSLHAALRCGADDRRALEQLCRDITRPALANERVQTNAAGQVVLKLKTPWRDGTTHLVMSPLVLMQRLAALAIRSYPLMSPSWF